LSTANHTAVAFGTDPSVDSSIVESEFQTPEAVCRLVLDVLDVRPGDRVADLCCGDGNFLAAAAGRTDGALYGVDVNPNAAARTAERVGRAEVENADAFEAARPGAFDKVFSHHPFGLRRMLMTGGGAYGGIFKGSDPDMGRPSTADWVFCRLAADSLAPGGAAAVLMTNGPAFNVADERARAFFVERGLLRAVVALPAGLFAHPSASTLLLVVGDNAGPVRMVDASDLYVRETRRRTTMGDDEVAEVLARLSCDGPLSRAVGADELAAADYNLLPTRYVGRNVDLVNPTRLGDLALSIDRGVEMRADELRALGEGGRADLRYLRLADIEDGRIGRGALRLSSVDDGAARQRLRTGDLLISKNGSPFKVAVADVDEGQTIIPNGNLYVVRLDTERVDPLFVAAYLESDDGRELMERMAVGAAIPSLPLKNLQELPVPVPDMGVQRQVARRYAAHLDEIEVLKIKLGKARAGVARAYDEGR
jgi:type I restriction enzyme M protein